MKLGGCGTVSTRRLLRPVEVVRSVDVERTSWNTDTSKLYLLIRNQKYSAGVFYDRFLVYVVFCSILAS